MANRALLVGVSRYSERSGFRELTAPVSDVKRLQECLQQNGDFEVISLIDASRQEVERQTRGLLTRARPDDKIVFYYSGHAQTTFPRGELLFALADYDQEDPEGGSIEKRKLFDWARDGAAGQLVMILDCCFAGADQDYGRSGSVPDSSELSIDREAGGTHVLMACDAQSRARSGDFRTEDGSASHFTDLLIRGLEGDAAPGKNFVTIRNLSTFLLERAPLELRVRPRILVEDAYGDFPLVRVKNPDRTLIPRELRNAAASLEAVERMGAVTLLGPILASPPSERHAKGAQELLEEIRDSPTSPDDVRRAAKEALAVRAAPRQLPEAEVTAVPNPGSLETSPSPLPITPPANPSASLPDSGSSPTASGSHRVFIVHGHDEAAREAVARLIERAGLEAVILREQTNQGRTIIEKFEQHGEAAAFAVVLLTPDDMGGPRGTPLDQQRYRARQNVVAELFFFIGRLGRGKVCPLVKGDVELPSDFSGVVYEPMDEAGNWRLKLALEMQAAGLPVDLNSVFRRLGGV